MKISIGFILLLLLGVFFVSCDNEDKDPLPVRTLFELQVPANMYHESIGSYILITGPDGAFLGMEKITNATTVVIDTAIASVPEKINVTQITVHPPTPNNNNSTSYYINTKTGVATGS